MGSGCHDSRHLILNGGLIVRTKEIAEKEQSNMIKDPDEWTTGDETMTGAQASYLKTLCDEAGEEFDPSLTKAEASKG